MFHLELFILQLLIAGPVSTVSPGDEAGLSCEELRSEGAAPIPAYSANMRVLMDSWNYRNLLPPRTGAVWDQVDKDVNNRVGLTTNWIQQSNTPCEQNVQVCGFSGGPQNNWLITQLINKTVNGTKLPQVSVTIEFELRDCDVTLMCQRTFNAHVFETSSESATRAKDITNYRQVDRVSPDITTGARVNETIDLSFTTNHSSFYFAIQDETACMVITRLMVFYHICPAEITDLVIRPETIAPPISRQSSLLGITATCVDNASPIVAGIPGPKVKCTEGGLWLSTPELGCECDHGFLPSMDRQRCEGCSDGQYFSTFTGVCLDCPENSTSSDGSTSLECICMDGYYFTPRGSDQNESCVATVVKEKTTSSSSLPIILSIVLLIAVIGAVITLFVFLYIKRRRSIGRAYQANLVAQRRNEQPTGANALQEEPIARPNGLQLRPPLLPPRQISTVSTRSYVSARSSATSFKWNIAYFLFKILGTPGNTESPVVPEPSDQTPVTNFESRDRTERYDTDDSASTAAHKVNVTTDAGLDFPHYVNINYELVGSGEQRAEDRNERPTTMDFNKEEYLRVLS